MSKQTLTVLRESRPSRCEVCHQTDQFDPETGVCQRCLPVLRSQIEPRNVMVPGAFQHLLQTELGTDEQLWWVGQPDSPVEERRQVRALSVVLSGIFTVFMATDSFSRHPFFIAGSLALFCAVLFGKSAVVARKVKKARHTLYAITSNRVLVLENPRVCPWQRRGGNSLQSFPREAFQTAVCENETFKGQGDLVLTAAAPDSQRRPAQVRIEQVAGVRKVQALVQQFLLHDHSHLPPKTVHEPNR